MPILTCASTLGRPGFLRLRLLTTLAPNRPPTPLLPCSKAQWEMLVRLRPSHAAAEQRDEIAPF
jgi:hypothetical protein